MEISRQNVNDLQIDAFRRLHDRWDRIVLKTLNFWQRFQINPVSPTISNVVVQTEG